MGKLNKNRARKETKQRNFKHSLGFWVGISIWKYLAGEMCLILVSKINEYYFLYINLLLKILRNIDILFTIVLVKFFFLKPKESILCCHSSGHSIIFWWLSAVTHSHETEMPFYIYVCPFPVYQSPSLALRSHDQIPASHWSTFLPDSPPPALRHILGISGRLFV